MALGRQLFRESALQRLQSPEQLDQVLQVTSPKGWLALSAIWILLVVVVVWSFVFDLPFKEHGRGIIIQLDTLQVIEAEGTGRLEAIDVEVRQLVQAGQIVARIDREELTDRIDDLESQLAELQAQHQTLDEREATRAQLERALAAEESRLLNDWIEVLEERIGEVEQELALIKDLVAQGAAGRLEPFRVEERLALKQTDLAEARLKLQEIAAGLERAEMDRQDARIKRRFEEHKLAGQIRLLERQHERESTVKCTVTGRVVDFLAAKNTLVEKGDDIMIIEPLEAGGTSPLAAADADGVEFDCPCRSGSYAAMAAIVYVSALTGKDRVRPGQIVHVSPSSVKPEEHGSIVGVVARIADYTTTAPAMMSVLNDRNLVDDFRASVGVPLEMRVLLCRDEETVTGLEWTSSEGPPTEISAGTHCKASVTVERRRPIDLVIPKLKEALGAD